MCTYIMTLKKLNYNMDVYNSYKVHAYQLTNQKQNLHVEYGLKGITSTM